MDTRQIRTKRKTKPTQTKSQKSRSRTVAQIHTAIEQAGKTESKLKELAGSLTDTEIGLLADQHLRDTEKSAEINKGISWIKPLLHLSAREQKWKKKEGDVSEAKAMAGSSTEFTCTVTQFVALLKKEGKLKLADDILSIRLGDAKKYLGEAAIAPVTKKKSDSMGRFSIARKKGK